MYLQNAVSLLTVAVGSGLLYLIFNYVPFAQYWSRKTQAIGQENPKKLTGIECPYEYLRSLYGKHHWAPFVNKLSPNLRQARPAKYLMILETMDVIHLCLMLVDDISDGSEYRKGKPAAHKIYGASETANRAYYRVIQVLAQTAKEFPSLSVWLTNDLRDVLEGQDMSLVWRRDGPRGFPADAVARERAYRKMVSLKTGGLFRLLGHLVLDNDSMDETFTTLGWNSQLQNDCKNVYSSEYAEMKGVIGEDLNNREMTYPIVLALDAPSGYLVARALKTPSRRNIAKALRVIQGQSVREACMEELARSGASVKEWLMLWKRNEKLDLKQ